MPSPFGRTFLYKASGLDLTSGGTITGNLVVTGTLGAGATTVTTLAPSGNLTMAATKQILADAGTTAAPGYAFSGAASTGFHANGGNPVIARSAAAVVTCSSGNANFTSNVTSSNDLVAARAVLLEPEAVKVVNYQVTNSDAIVIMNGTTLTATLPATPATNQMLWVKNVDAGSCTIARNGKTIDGAAADITLLTLTSTLLVYNGTGWYRIGN